MNDIQVRYAVGRGGRFAAVAILPGVDILLGLKKVCNEAGIKSGAVIACSGSLRKATLYYTFPQQIGTSDPNNSVNFEVQAKFGFKYAPIVELSGPIQLVSTEGTISYHESSGDIEVHIHGMVVDHYGKAYGGHFVEGGNLALTTLDVVLCETEGVEMIRKKDPEFFNLPTLYPESK